MGGGAWGRGGGGGVRGAGGGGGGGGGRRAMVLTGAQQAELSELLSASAAAFGSLDAGSLARDEIRLLHAKLRDLSAAAPHAAPREWDAMLRSVLADRHCGLAALRSALRAEGKGHLLPLEEGAEDQHDGRRSCVAPHRAGASEAPTRRILSADAEQRLLQAGASVEPRRGVRGEGSIEGASERERIMAHGPSDPRSSPAIPASDVATAFGREEYRISLAIAEWKEWLLNRPPPWERDCDCCFEECPKGFNCLRQTDGLLIGCRGQSVGELLQWQWQQRPIVISVSTVLAMSACCLWFRARARRLRLLSKRRKRSND